LQVPDSAAFDKTGENLMAQSYSSIFP